MIKDISRRGVRTAEREYMDKTLAVPLHPLTNIEIPKDFSCEPRFYGVFPRNNLPRIKHGAYVINLDDKKVKGHIGFHYLLIEIQLCTLILLELNILL